MESPPHRLRPLHSGRQARDRPSGGSTIDGLRLPSRASPPPPSSRQRARPSRHRSAEGRTWPTDASTFDKGSCGLAPVEPSVASALVRMTGFTSSLSRLLARGFAPPWFPASTRDPPDRSRQPPTFTTISSDRGRSVAAMPGGSAPRTRWRRGTKVASSVEMRERESRRG